jgi:hypothetical protein
MRAVTDADRVAATFRRALDRLDDAALYESDQARPDDFSLMRVRRLDSPALFVATDLAARYVRALQAVHESLGALVVLEGFGRPRLPPRASPRRSLVPVAEARVLTEALVGVLQAVSARGWHAGDQGWILIAVEPLSALRGRFWSQLAWRECRYGCGRAAEGGRSTCRRHRSDRVA